MPHIAVVIWKLNSNSENIQSTFKYIAGEHRSKSDYTENSQSWSSDSGHEEGMTLGRISQVDTFTSGADVKAITTTRPPKKAEAVKIEFMKEWSRTNKTPGSAYPIMAYRDWKFSWDRKICEKQVNARNVVEAETCPTTSKQIYHNQSGVDGQGWEEAKCGKETKIKANTVLQGAGLGSIMNWIGIELELMLKIRELELNWNW